MYKRNGKKKRGPFSWVKFLKLSFVYFVVFLMAFSLIDYYALMAFNFLWFILFSAVLGLGFGFVHVRKHWHDNIDLVAEELL
ncbi:hypothetical protein [Nitratifractor sp.]